LAARQSTSTVTRTNTKTGFGGSLVYNTAQMEWTATVGDYRFVSAPLNTSSSAFALLGQERNGAFFE
jgi:hypothetical protein